MCLSMIMPFLEKYMLFHTSIWQEFSGQQTKHDCHNIVFQSLTINEFHRNDNIGISNSIMHFLQM